jgi:hypothetical protein
MYSSDAVLQQQIKALAGVVQRNERNASLQLLLGYNELGIGELDKAQAALKIAGTDPANEPTATALLKVHKPGNRQTDDRNSEHGKCASCSAEGGDTCLLSRN